MVCLALHTSLYFCINFSQYLVFPCPNGTVSRTIWWFHFIGARTFRVLFIQVNSASSLSSCSSPKNLHQKSWSKRKVNMAELCRIWTFDHLISRLKLYHETTDLCCKWDVKTKNDKYRSLTFYEDFWKMNLLKAEFPTSGTFSLLQPEKLWIYKRDFFLNH